MILRTPLNSMWSLFGMVLLTISSGASDCQGQTDPPTPQSLIAAAQRGDVDGVRRAVEAGVPVDSKTHYGSTALFFACDRGNRELVKYLLDQGADPNVKDTFYQATPLTWAQSKGHQEILEMLFAAGGDGAEQYFLGRVIEGELAPVRSLVDNEVVGKPTLIRGRAIAHALGPEHEPLRDFLDGLELPPRKTWEQPPAEQAQPLTGRYRSTRVSLTVAIVDDRLQIGFGDDANLAMVRIGPREYLFGQSWAIFAGDPDQPATEVTVSMGNSRITCRRATDDADGARPAEDAMPAGDAVVDRDDPTAQNPPSAPDPALVEYTDLDVSSDQWPGFRGTGARGIADQSKLLTEWDLVAVAEAETADAPPPASAAEVMRWKTPVAGLGLSCPTIWDDQIYLTTAVADGDDQNVKIGLYGDVSSVEEDREYEFRVLCLSKTNGSILWQQVANRTKPAVKRHAKSSHANPTVATDGTHVVAFFGSEGLYCYDRGGNLRWKRDLGVLDSGWFYDPGYQWGFGSSPVIHQDRVMVQCDVQGQSFVAAYSLDNGVELWRQTRDEIPSWSTPTVHEFDDVTMLITQGTRAARGYDVQDGRELWRLEGHSEIVVPTPTVAHGLIYLASGYSPIQPIYAVRPSARGDISLPEGESSSDAVAWSVKRGGPYMPSPIVYGNYLYCCANNGILSCYDAKTGDSIYRKRMKATGGPLSFTASPIAARGKLYCTAEDGRVLVVTAGPKFEIESVNTLGEPVLATPAVSGNVLFFRTQRHLIAIGDADESATD